MTDLTEVLARAIHEHRISGVVWSEMERRDCRDQAADILAALDAAGYQIVPKEPTREMVKAGKDACWEDMPDDGVPYQAMTTVAYKAMLAAVPKS